jgi:hypothetical protein
MIKIECKKIDDKHMACAVSFDGERKILFQEFAGIIRAMIRVFKSNNNNEKESAITRGIIADILEQIEDEL